MAQQGPRELQHKAQLLMCLQEHQSRFLASLKGMRALCSSAVSSLSSVGCEDTGFFRCVDDNGLAQPLARADAGHGVAHMKALVTAGRPQNDELPVCPYPVVP